MSSRTKYNSGIECCKILVKKIEDLVREVKKDNNGFLKAKS